MGPGRDTSLLVMWLKWRNLDTTTYQLTLYPVLLTGVQKFTIIRPQHWLYPTKWMAMVDRTYYFQIHLECSSPGYRTSWYRFDRSNADSVARVPIGNGSNNRQQRRIAYRKPRHLEDTDLRVYGANGQFLVSDSAAFSLTGGYVCEREGTNGELHRSYFYVNVLPVMNKL